MDRGRIKQVIAIASASLAGYALTVFANHEMDNRDLNSGEVLYAKHCQSCHGKYLEGEPNWREPKADGTLPAPPHDASGHTWHHDNQMLFDYTKLGGEKMFSSMGLTNIKSGMPGFEESLTDENIWDVLAFIRSTWPDQIIQIQDGLNPQHN